jgi:hypothetical protein
MLHAALAVFAGTALAAAQPLPSPLGFAAVTNSAPEHDTVGVVVSWQGVLQPGDYWRWVFESPATNGAGYTTSNAVALMFTVSATNSFMVRGERNLTNASAWASADWVPYRTQLATLHPWLEAAPTPKGPWSRLTNSLPMALTGASAFFRPAITLSNWVAIQKR